jgi:hypothetical protein
MPDQDQQKKQIQIKFPEEAMKGVYSNNMQVMNNKEEFVMDFMNILPPNGIVNARVITSPGHMKRIVKALAGSLKKYEDQFGAITEADNPNEIGFKA